jgi:hypothetical protein
MSTTTIDPTTDTLQLTINNGDNLWDNLKANATDLNYTESELQASPELFVWISVNNGIIENFRNISPRTLTVPKHSVLANVVVVVRADSITYPQKFFEWVNMDRCAVTS